LLAMQATRFNAEPSRFHRQQAGSYKRVAGQQQNEAQTYNGQIRQAVRGTRGMFRTDGLIAKTNP